MTREPFVLQPSAGARWVVHAPQDPYGDGYVYTIATELHEDGMTATAVANIDGLFVASKVTRLDGFIKRLTADWQGWDGVRTWRSVERELSIDGRHRGRGYVSLGVTLRAPCLSLEETAWSARAVFVLEAGEEISRFAADLTHFLRT